ncbi:MAG: 7-cyano-7-deazaguanine reductase [Gammaproteobacteria bacterium]
MPRYLGQSDSYQKISIGKESLDILKRKTNSSFPLRGWDYWNAYEFMYQNQQSAVLTCLEIKVPSDSMYLIESKSMKLFLNSFYNQEFQSTEITNYLSDVFSETLECKVEVKIMDKYSDPPNFKKLSRNTGKLDSGSIYRFEGYRSLCPVTSQPDFANVFFYSNGFSDLDSSILLDAIGLHLNQQAFHESCIEAIAEDILHIAQLKDLQIFGRFLRRGGIDINPLRCFNISDSIFCNFREFNQ